MKTKKVRAHVTIDLADVESAGGVTAALAQWCADSDDTSCGVIGPSFATSGPGSGWCAQFDETDYAPRAFADGALYYLDKDDGRLASSPEWTDDLYSGQPVEWTDESVVRIECPSIEDAIQSPTLVAEMAQAIIDYHNAESDLAMWHKLLVEIRNVAKAIEDIDLDDLLSD
jgi:hypothetical protein